MSQEEYIKQLEEANDYLMNITLSEKLFTWKDSFDYKDKSIINRSNLLFARNVMLGYIVLADVGEWHMYFVRYHRDYKNSEEGYTFERHEEAWGVRTFEESMMDDITYAKNRTYRRVMSSLGNMMRFI